MGIQVGDKVPEFTKCVVGRDGLVHRANPNHQLAKPVQYEAAVAALKKLAG